MPHLLPPCTHTPACPAPESTDRSAARIVSDHLQDCGYALLCNGLILLEGDDLLSVPEQRRRAEAGSCH
ncbi:MAG: hypothetical protein NVS3B26_28440 [Mycobacteriales bacterium]